MATIDIEDQIKARLDALSTIAPSKVYLYEEAPLDDQLPTSNGMLVAYSVIHAGDPRSSTSDRGICGVEKDPVENYVIVETIAPNTTIAKQIGKAIVDDLFGRKFEGATALSLGGQQRYKRKTDSTVVPYTYNYSTLFRYTTNL
jgi:hypothetical protein